VLRSGEKRTEKEGKKTGTKAQKGLTWQPKETVKSKRGEANREPKRNLGSIKQMVEIEVVDLSGDDKKETPPRPTAAKRHKVIHEEEESDVLIQDLDLGHTGQLVGFVSDLVNQTLFCNQCCNHF
jgi:hypothetical protein